MPSPASLAHLYSQQYYEKFASGPGIAGGNEELSPHLRKRLQDLTVRVGQGRIVDVGCAEGIFVAHAQAEGWDAIGLETSDWAADYGRRRFGVRILQTPLEEAPIAPQSVDVIHANHVLEHLPDPVVTLRAAYRALRPGGLLVAEVPQERVRPLADAMLEPLRSVHCKLPNYHLVYFSRCGLEIAAKRSGFGAVSITNIRHEELSRTRTPPLAFARSLVYRVERVLGRAPAYVLVASRPS